MQEENALAAEYEKLYASAKIPFMGKTLTVAQLAAYKENPDREIRKKAVEAEGGFFDEHRDAFDDIYDQLVKNRTKQAKTLGFENYVELSYIRQMRNCYTAKDVDAYRNEVIEQIVPITVEIKANQAKRIGVDHIRYCGPGFFVSPTATRPPRARRRRFWRRARGCTRKCPKKPENLFRRCSTWNCLTSWPRKEKRPEDTVPVCLSINVPLSFPTLTARREMWTF